MAGYQRQDTTGQLANGNPIDADIFNDEYDAIESAFNASSGHTHDGTAGGGAPIESIGPSQELEVTSSAVFPKNNNLIDHGKTALRWKDGYYGGTVYAEDAVINDDASVGGDLTVTGTTTLNGNTVVGDAATDTVTVNADVASNLIPDATGTRNLGSSTMEWNDIFIDGTATVDTLTVDENATVAGTLDVTGNTGIDGDFDINTDKFTVASATGNTLVAGTLDVNGATTVVGAVDITGDTDITGNGLVSGTLAVGGATGIDGNFDINTDKFTVAASTGNTVIAGTLDVSGAFGMDGDFDVNTNKFTVAAATGNTAIAGTLDVTGNQTNTGDLTVNGNTVLGDAATDTVTLNADVASNIIPDTTSTYTIGDSSNYWSHGYIDAITTSGDVGVGGNVTITGDLTVSGTTTTVNSTTVEIADLNIEVASNAATAAAANGGGLTVGGADATLTYDSTTDRWDMNKDLEVANVYADLTGNVTGNIDGIIGGTTPAAVTGTTVQFNTGLTDGTITIDGFVDEDDMTSDSDTKVPTQQSVKAYVDAAVAGDGTGDIEVDTVDATTIDLGGGTGWTITANGTTLEFKYNGTVRFKMTSTGTFQADDDVEAEAF